jgi:hypothetical protein
MMMPMPVQQQPENLSMLDLIATSRLLVSPQI